MPATPPTTITSVLSSPADAYLTIGAVVTFQVNLSAPVTVSGGVPSLALSDGGTAVYDAAHSTPTMLLFTHTIQAGQNTPDLSVVAASLNGATISGGYGNQVGLTGAVGNPAGILKVDTVAPQAISFDISGTLTAGSIISFTFTYNEDVVKTGGTPTFTLNNGGTATYSYTLSTPRTSVFTYISQGDENLNSVTLQDFNLNGSVLTDLAGNLMQEDSVMQVLEAPQGNFSSVDVTSTSPLTIDVYRFFDQRTGSHFYTQDMAERTTILSTRPDLIPEGSNGVGFTALDPASRDPNAVAIYRFFDVTQGTQFLTSSSAERDAVIATRSDLVYQPTQNFYEHTTQQAGDTAVYRFFNTTNGSHFYTGDASERATILASRPDLVSEGVGFYAPLKYPAA